jgi:hypothetical protein
MRRLLIALAIALPPRLLLRTVTAEVGAVTWVVAGVVVTWVVAGVAVA